MQLGSKTYFAKCVKKNIASDKKCLLAKINIKMCANEYTDMFQGGKSMHRLHQMKVCKKYANNKLVE